MKKLVVILNKFHNMYRYMPRLLHACYFTIYLYLSIYLSLSLSHTQAQQLCIFFYLQKGVTVKIFFISNHKKVLNMRDCRNIIIVMMLFVMMIMIMMRNKSNSDFIYIIFYLSTFHYIHYNTHQALKLCLQSYSS
jgi:hypothetical protein